MKNLKRYPNYIAAAKSGMDVKTARKYRQSGKLPSEAAKPNNGRTRRDPFSEHWSEIENFLSNAPGLQAKVVLEYLIDKYPHQYQAGQLRTLQRRFKDWSALHGKAKDVIFRQDIKPGRQSQSDCTWMNALGITIQGAPFPHMLFHFMLPYSKWEHVTICKSESFASITAGYEAAVFALGYVAPEHRTDNLSAATCKLSGSAKRTFTESWDCFLKHFSVKPSRNNPGQSHENGSVEKSNDLFKTAVTQRLLLRGSHDFASVDAYQALLKTVEESRNKGRQKRLLEELPYFKDLPRKKWDAPDMRLVTVSPSSTIHIDSVPYSVPSRLIAYQLKAYLYHERIDLYYGEKKLQSMPKSDTPLIDYRHIIDSLIRKPGAFFNYQYHQALFPNLVFRKAYDALHRAHPSNGHKLYLKLLQLAKLHQEQTVIFAVELLLSEMQVPEPNSVKALLDSGPKLIATSFVRAPNLSDYDQLLAAH